MFQELKQELVDRSGKLSSLKLLGKKVVPLKQRGVPVTSKTPVQAVCNYKQMQVWIVLNSQLWTALL